MLFVFSTFGFSTFFCLMHFRKQLFIAPLIIAASFSSRAQQKPSYIESLSAPNAWVDSVFSKLSTRRKIAQLFFVRAHTNMGKAYEDSVGKVIRRQRVGGLVFFQGGPGRQASGFGRHIGEPNNRCDRLGPITSVIKKSKRTATSNHDGPSVD